MNLEQLANETGFSVDYLKEIESGKEIPPVGALLLQEVASGVEHDLQGHHAHQLAARYTHAAAGCQRPSLVVHHLGAIRLQEP